MSNLKHSSNSKFRLRPKSPPPLKSAYTCTSIVCPSAELARWEEEKNMKKQKRIADKIMLHRNETFLVNDGSPSLLPGSLPSNARFVTDVKDEQLPPIPNDKFSKVAEFDRFGYRVSLGQRAATPPCPQLSLDDKHSAENIQSLMENLMSKRNKNRENSHIKTSEEESIMGDGLSQTAAATTTAKRLAKEAPTKRKTNKNIKKQLALDNWRYPENDVDSMVSSDPEPMSDKTPTPNISNQLNANCSVMTQCDELGANCTILQTTSTQTLDNTLADDQNKKQQLMVKRRRSARDLFETKRHRSAGLLSICACTIIFAAMFSWTFVYGDLVFGYAPRCLHRYMITRYAQLFAEAVPPEPEPVAAKVYDQWMTMASEFVARCVQTAVSAVDWLRA